MDGNTSSDRILKNLTDHFEKVGHDERSCLIRQLEGMLRRLICRNIREDVPPEVSCPWCQGHTYVRYGLTETGRQRYRCGNCRRTFSDGSVKNLLTNSKLPAETWLRYCGCFANLYSLRKCARICDVSPNTSFFMRRRIPEMLFIRLPAFRAEAGMDIQVDEIYIRDSYKGPDRDGRLPRRARRRGKGSGPGLTRNSSV
ncbi:MAG: hypothetical protein MJZ38_00545 [archaeon]|nr:hypothetical protein [archaeon]